MKFTIETGVLNAALDIAAVAVDHRLSLPILGNVRIEAKGEQVTVTTTNLDLFVAQTLPAKVSMDGAITVPFELLHKLTGRLQSTQTEIESNARLLNISSGEVDAVLETLPEEEFPPMPTQNREGKTVCDAKDLLTPFSKVSHAMSKDTSRYNLMGVNLNGEEFVSSDGRRLAIFIGREFTKESVIAPDIFVRAILKIQPAGEIEVAVVDGFISVVSPTIQIVCKLIEANFPSWKQVVLDKPGKHIFGCDRKELIEALRTCAIFKDGVTNALQMTGRGKEIEVSKDESIKARVLGNELSGVPKITKRFNASYMLDALGVLEEQNCAIHCSEENQTTVIQEGPLKLIINGMAPQ